MSSRSPEKSERYFPQFFQEGNKLDLSGQCLTKVPKHALPSQLPKITQLLLDHNELRRFDNLQQYSSLIEFSASHNELYKMCQCSHLKHLVRLDLSHNSILAIEGLKDLVHLTYLNLSHNKIKVIDNLQTNQQLEHLDLSENSITVISNINRLSKLKKLYLHKNSISLLKHCGVYLPVSLETLTLAGNKIADLNEVSHLAGLINLKEISIVANPCVQMTGNEAGFDYRPFLINWCASLKLIDGFAVDDIESLKGEWLYSQGRGHQFRPGQHAALVQYLVETCPLNNQNLQTEHERKLRLILSKAHHHQSQLRMAENPIQVSATSSKMLKNPFSGLMTQSLDPSLLDSCSSAATNIGPRKVRGPFTDHPLTRSLHCEPPATKDIEPLAAYSTATAPLPAASKLVPVPESLISPMVTNTPPLVSTSGAKCSEGLTASKLQTIKFAAEKKKVRRSHGNDREQAAICIQKMWRGYHTRNLNPKVLSIYHHLQTKRTNQHIMKLSQEMEATRAGLDSGHKLQILQMQAINALWRKPTELNFELKVETGEPSESQEEGSSLNTESSPTELNLELKVETEEQSESQEESSSLNTESSVVSLQPAGPDESRVEVKDLAQTCERLNAQVQQLQSCMQEVLRCVSPSSSSAMATQTDIVAVHTPSQDTSDLRFLHSRPSTLPIPPQQVTQYADCLVVGVINDTVKDSATKEGAKNESGEGSSPPQDE